jgi:outer membrane lipoprotein carrier protein
MRLRLRLTIPAAFAVISLAAHAAHEGSARAQAPAVAAAPVATQAQVSLRPLPAAEADALVGKVQAFYDKTTSFSCDFTQEFWVKAYNQKKSSHGKVTFAKPGKMNWEYAEPANNRVVSDGMQLRVYEAANKQLYEQTINQSQYPAALSFLTGQGKLAAHFNFELFEGEQMNFPGGYVLVGTPKQATAAYQKVLFYVDKQSSQVRRVMILDAQGNRNRFDFQNPQVNLPLAPTHFNFTPPPGTSIIRP